MVAIKIAEQHERKVVDRVVLRLPVPPSSNDVWALRKGGKGLRLSPAYTRWLTSAGWLLAQQRPGRIGTGYVLTIWMPSSSRMDLDNAVAAVSDLLQDHRVVSNDREAEETHLHWHGTSDDVVIEVTRFAGPMRSQRPCSAAPSSSDSLIVRREA